MPLRKHDPVPEEDMFQFNPEQTICQTLRDIYHEARKLGLEKIMLSARVATSMAKSMSNKLVDYKAKNEGRS